MITAGVVSQEETLVARLCPTKLTTKASSVR